MNIKFNNYKGFFIGGSGDKDDRVDVRVHLPQLKKSIGKNKTKKKNDNLLEYRTDGFDSLNIAWSLFEYRESDEDEEDNLTIEETGTKLRLLSYKTSNDSPISNDDLSSHTTLYGQILETKEDDVEDNIIKDERKKLNKSESLKKKKKLTLDERKETRMHARNSKKAAALLKKNRKLANDETDIIPTTNLSGVKSKIKHLKELLEECIEICSKTGDKLQDTSKIYQLDDVSLYLIDLRNLLDDEWLSDSNISWVYTFIYYAYALPLLSDSLKNSKFYQFNNDDDNNNNNNNSNKEVFISPICLLLPTFTFLIANSSDPEDLVKCKVLPQNISDSQFIFCPLNDNDDFGCSEGGSHWSLVVFCKLQSLDDLSKKEYIQKALVFDSMYEANATETERLVKNMTKVLHNPKDPKSNLNWNIEHIRDSPQQTNGSDCGIYVSSITAYLISQLIALVRASSVNKDSFTDLSLKDLRFSAINSRIWMLSTLLNCLKNQK
ncbi:hypothetical protein C6P42_003969 [Pichia californica]|nr:hypothetical protein C6P42_003969 [[Candida] californica]